MAALGTDQYAALYTQVPNEPLVCGLYTVKGVATGDTLDLSGPFRRLFSAGFVDVTANAVQSAPTLGGAGNTTLTFAAAGMTNNAGFLLVVGVPR